MAQTRTAKGTNASKTNGTALTVSGVQGTAGTALVVGIAWEDNVQGDKPELKWGNRVLKFVVGSERQRGDTIVRQYKTRVKTNKTKDMTATWANAVDARAMFVTEITEGSKVDVQNENDAASTTAPATGPAVTPTVANTISIAAFAVIGPTSDAAATAGAGHTIGQRVGTTGGGAASNITLQETFEILTAIGNVRATLTLTTARAYAANIVAYRAVETYTIFNTFHKPWKVYSDSNVVVLQIEDAAQTHIFDVQIPVEIFEILSDAQVSDYVASAAQWYTDLTESENDREDPDTDVETRLATFENDEVIL